MRPCVRNAPVIAKASAGVGVSTGRMFHSARAELGEGAPIKTPKIVLLGLPGAHRVAK
jgi:hypothetical protein